MRLKIVTIADRGIPNKERLHLNVLAQANLSFYVVLGTTKISPTLVSTAPKYFHWWSDYAVNAGDSVILYTRSGLHTVNVRPGGGRNHFFELTTWETSP